MKKLFNKGDVVYVGGVRYEKLSDDPNSWWVCLTSTYNVEKVNDKGEKYEEPRPESEKPLYRKDGSLNRFGFKWPDEQVITKYKKLEE